MRTRYGDPHTTGKSKRAEPGPMPPQSSSPQAMNCAAVGQPTPWYTAASWSNPELQPLKVAVPVAGATQRNQTSPALGPHVSTDNALVVPSVYAKGPLPWIKVGDVHSSFGGRSVGAMPNEAVIGAVDANPGERPTWNR